MKIFISACAALITSTLIVLFSLFYTSTALNTEIDILLPLPTTIADDAKEKTSEEILGCLRKAENYWSDKSPVLSHFISHRDLDEIESHIVALISAVKTGDSGHYASTLASLREKLEKLSASEKLSLGGIF